MNFLQLCKLFLSFFALPLGDSTLLGLLFLNFLPLDHFTGQVCQLDLEALEHEGLRVSVPRDNVVEVFLRHGLLETGVVAIVGEVALQIPLQKESAPLLDLFPDLHEEHAKLVMTVTSLDRDYPAQRLLVPALLQNHADPILKLVCCSRSLA